MKLFIFSIGGSGSRVVRSLSMLMAAGVPHLKASDQVFPIMIDYDVDNGDTKRAFKCVDTYNDMYKSAYAKELEKNKEEEKETPRSLFRTCMMKMADMGGDFKSGYTLQFRHNPNDKTFGDAIAYDRLRDDKARTKDLLKTLFDVSNGQDTELGIDMTVGFKGNPNIGSIVFNNLKDTDELKEFFNCYQQGDKVILVGSLFGGTGASGIPEITKAIRENDKTKDAYLGVVMLLPYFCFEPNKEVGTVKSGLFDSKTQAALAYYTASLVDKKIDSIYYVGDNERIRIPYCQGGKDQVNNSHIVDLIGATSILHFFRSDKPTELKRYKYRIHDNEPDHAPGFTILNFYKDEYTNIIGPLVKFAFTVKFFISEIAKKTDAVTQRTYSQAFGLPLYFTDGIVGKPDSTSVDNFDNKEKYEPGLHSTLYNFQQFANLFIQWVEELKQNGNRKLVMFDFNQPIVSLVQDRKLSSMERSVFSWGAKVETDMVEPLDFSEDIQKHYAKKYQDGSVKGNDHHYKGSTAGYAFIDSLYTGIENTLKRPKIENILKIG